MNGIFVFCFVLVICKFPIEDMHIDMTFLWK